MLLLTNKVNKISTLIDSEIGVFDSQFASSKAIFRTLNAYYLITLPVLSLSCQYVIIKREFNGTLIPGPCPSLWNSTGIVFYSDDTTETIIYSIM